MDHPPRSRWFPLGDSERLGLFSASILFHRDAPAVQRWAVRHKRFHFHFTPTSSSWLNMVERFFRDLTENQLRRGIFTSVEALKPFIWAAKTDDILEKVKRAKANLNNSPSV